MIKTENFVIFLGTSDWCLDKISEINYLTKQLDCASDDDARVIINRIRAIAHDITTFCMEVM